MNDIPMPRTSFDVKDGDTVVVETGNTKFEVAIDTHGHRLIADEPVNQGGENTGPNPYDLLLSALGACTSMTVRMYAAHKGLPLERIAVRLHHEKIHAKDCLDCTTTEGKVDVITSEVELIGDKLTPVERERLMEIARMCPVHRSLNSEVKIRTTEKTEGTKNV